MLSPYEQDTYQDYQDFEPSTQPHQPRLRVGEVATNALIALTTTQFVTLFARSVPGIQPFCGLLIGGVLISSLCTLIFAQNSIVRFFGGLCFGAVGVGFLAGVWDFVRLVFSHTSSYFIGYQVGLSLFGLLVGGVLLLVWRMAQNDSSSYF